MIKITAFQIGGFQFTGFQEAQTVSGSGGRNWLRFLGQIKRKPKPKVIEEVVYEPIPLPQRVPLHFIAKPVVTDLSALAARISPPILDENKELEDFRELMQMIAEMHEEA
jgi:hypothetical protein